MSEPVGVHFRIIVDCVALRAWTKEHQNCKVVVATRSECQCARFDRKGKTRPAEALNKNESSDTHTDSFVPRRGDWRYRVLYGTHRSRSRQICDDGTRDIIIVIESRTRPNASKTGSVFHRHLWGFAKILVVLRHRSQLVRVGLPTHRLELLSKSRHSRGLQGPAVREALRQMRGVLFLHQRKARDYQGGLAL